jgi:hypothetical protein
MRLTLRTLLAYRDGVLPQADHDDLHRRIQQSPDAGNLLRRIQELTSNSEVLTPKLESTGLAGPNVIAEYLDDVLTSSRIAELERLFLEYNEHLCELAHCHQIIAQALHTHVEIPETLRQTALALINPDQRAEIKSHLLTQSKKLSKQVVVAEIVKPTPSTDSSEGSPTGGYNSSSTTATTTKLAAGGGLTSSTTLSASQLAGEANLSGSTKVVSSSTQQAGLNLEGVSLTNEVPEYLLGSRRRRWLIPAAILSLTGLLLLLVWQSIGSWDQLSALMHAKIPEQGQNSNEKPADNLNGDQAASGDNAGDNTQPVNNGQPPVADDKAAGADDPADVALIDPDVVTPAVKSSIGDQVDATNPPPTEPDVAAPMQPDDNVTKADVAANIEGSSATVGLVWNPSDDSERQNVVLLQTDDSISLLPIASQPIQACKLVLPPVTRATLNFGSWKWLAVGPGTVEFDYADDKQRVRSAMCRALLSTSNPGQPLILSSPQGDYEVQLLDKLGWIGIEIGLRPAVQGSLLEPNTYVPVVILVAGIDGPSTSAQLMSVKALADNSTIQIDSAANGVAIIAGKMESFALQSPPGWYRKKSVRAIDLLGMSDFQKALAASPEPLNEKLRALAADPRPELASLAIQTSLLLGDWQPWAKELLFSDRMRSHWMSNISLARQLLAGNALLIKQLQTELQLQQIKESDRVTELLIGTNKDALNTEGLQTLVKGLEANNSLPIRVLSAYQLKQLTGEDFGYQPHAPVKSTIQQWRSKISGNKIGIVPIEDPLVERVAQP